MFWSRFYFLKVRTKQFFDIFGVTINPFEIVFFYLFDDFVRIFSFFLLISFQFLRSQGMSYYSSTILRFTHKTINFVHLEIIRSIIRRCQTEAILGKIWCIASEPIQWILMNNEAIHSIFLFTVIIINVFNARTDTFPTETAGRRVLKIQITTHLDTLRDHDWTTFFIRLFDKELAPQSVRIPSANFLHTSRVFTILLFFLLLDLGSYVILKSFLLASTIVRILLWWAAISIYRWRINFTTKWIYIILFLANLIQINILVALYINIVIFKIFVWIMCLWISDASFHKWKCRCIILHVIIITLYRRLVAGLLQFITGIILYRIIINLSIYRRLSWFKISRLSRLVSSVVFVVFFVWMLEKLLTLSIFLYFT